MTEQCIITSAIEHWDQAWGNNEERSRWLQPEREVINIVPLMKERNVRDVLDLGCGVGRHAIFMAQEGFNVSAIDGSPQGVAFLRQEADEQKLAVATCVGGMNALPYAQGSFDYILAWNVIYHGDTNATIMAVNDIARMLRPGGIFQGTMLSKSNIHYGRGTEIAPDTFIDTTGTDKGHPHSYYSEKDLVEIFSAFKILRLEHVEHQNYDGAFHWHLLLTL